MEGKTGNCMIIVNDDWHEVTDMTLTHDKIVQLAFDPPAGKYVVSWRCEGEEYILLESTTVEFHPGMVFTVTKAPE
jgi:hypothetical protein